VDKFVIVVEVDNKRAVAAYSNGLADLDRVMPQLMAAAKERDLEDQRKSEAEQARYDREMADYKAAKQAFYEANRRYLTWLSGSPVFRGPQPETPEYPTAPTSPTASWIRAISFEAQLERIRSELVHMRDVAQAATAPFRMTEFQVRQMVAWEDGSEVESLQRGYLPSSTQDVDGNLEI
jgi:hypothetical protein